MVLPPISGLGKLPPRSPPAGPDGGRAPPCSACRPATCVCSRFTFLESFLSFFVAPAALAGAPLALSSPTATANGVISRATTAAAPRRRCPRVIVLLILLPSSVGDAPQITRCVPMASVRDVARTISRGQSTRPTPEGERPPATSRIAVNAPNTGSSAGSTLSAARMSKPSGGGFQHISRFPRSHPFDAHRVGRPERAPTFRLPRLVGTSARELGHPLSHVRSRWQRGRAHARPASRRAVRGPSDPLRGRRAPRRPSRFRVRT